MSLGSNISFLRKQRKMTQEQFADYMNVARQTVSRWESDEIVPELERLLEMCKLFSCKLDTLVRGNLSDHNGIYSDISIRRVAKFKYASYVIISPDPETDALGYMYRWAENSGLKKAYNDVKLIGWDFPFLSHELIHRFGLHGYVAACIIPNDFEIKCPGVHYAENDEADYAVITITEPFIHPFERIPNAYKLIKEYIKNNGYKAQYNENSVSCFEYEYQKDGITYMDIYVNISGATNTEYFAF